MGASAPPLVTVLLAVYNGEDLLSEAVESVLEQTVADFELLIIDDGSTDSTPAILASLNDPRIWVFTNHRNMGVTRTRNRGVELARGEFIAVHDHDDVSAPERLEKQVVFLRENPDYVAVSCWHTFHMAGQPDRLARPSVDDLSIRWKMLFGTPLPHPGLVMRASAMKAVGGYDESFITCTLDYDIECRLSRIGKLRNLPEPLVSVRRRPESISVQRKAKQEAYRTQISSREMGLLLGGGPVTRRQQADVETVFAGKLPQGAECRQAMALSLRLARRFGEKYGCAEFVSRQIEPVFKEHAKRGGELLFSGRPAEALLRGWAAWEIAASGLLRGPVRVLQRAASRRLVAAAAPKGRPMPHGVKDAAGAVRRRLGRMRAEWRRRRTIRRHRRASRPGPAARPNVVLVVADALRADHLGCYGYERATSPALDRWSERGLVLERCFSTSTWTMPALASLLSGLWPCRHKAVQYPNPPALQGEVPTLPAILGRAGYFCMALHGGGYVSKLPKDVAAQFHIFHSPALRFERIVPLALRYIRMLGRSPFFLLLHGLDCHRPYEPARRHDRFFPDYRGHFEVSKLGMPGGKIPQSADDLRRIVAAYDGEILGLDEALGAFLTRLEGLGLLDDTLVLITSDHGEEFGEHGGFDHTSTLYDELLHVPMIALGAGVHAGRDDRLASLADVFAAVLQRVGLECPPCDGVSFFEPPREAQRMVVAETGYGEDYHARITPADRALKPSRRLLLRAGRTARDKINLDHQDQPLALHDLASDPAEMRSVLEAEEPRARELRERFLAAVDGITAEEILAAAPKDQVQDSPEVREALKHLGYF